MATARSRDVLKSIAANVRRLRSKRKLTQQQLAEEAGVDLRYLQKIEAAEIDFGVSLLEVLADALDVKPSTLLKSARLASPVRGRPPNKGP